MGNTHQVNEQVCLQTACYMDVHILAEHCVS